jgi:hypothetical protein
VRRPPRRVLVSLWALAGVMTLLSLSFATPASADTVTPVRHCMHGDGYREVDGDSSSVVTAPEGYLIVSYCVDGRGRRGSSEVRTLSTPQRTTVVRHSDGRPLEGYSVDYTRVPSSDEPEAETETEEDAEDGRDENDEPGQSVEAEAEQDPPAEDEETAAAGASKKAGKAETPSANATEKEQEPSREPSVEISALPEDSSQMTALSDGEELRTTSVKEFEDEDDEENLRSLVVAGGIIIVGLLAGAIALLVRIPGQR